MPVIKKRRLSFLFYIIFIDRHFKNFRAKINFFIVDNFISDAIMILVAQLLLCTCVCSSAG